MAHAHTCGAQPGSAPAVDILLALDTMTWLDRHPHGDPASTPVDVEPDACYGLASGSGPEAPLRAGKAAHVHVDARPGARLRLRWTPLALRGEHAVLLQLSLGDDATLADLQLHIDEHATRYAPQAGTPERPASRQAPDAFWQADVVAPGTVSVDAEATVTDRDAQVIARFRWPLRIEVVTPSI
ncbi:AidA/PixA family protein [Pandoraea pulmonicola]|uniref:Inclusion body protein n=1 Tax=Pandoraea pulmonicola TaxID=93221 RepID=A0AAJ4ZHI9_PANPU|nr:AidA/PixA family protein [Pandoraea pulmonicola]APD13500.1 hypothetical protein RO07_25435 [Pandoraea pulmonicola]SUA93429.1 Inclusion body protein [Pandoraea pulmonicola]